MSLSPHCHRTAKLSLGLTAEQQALGLEAAIMAGFDEGDVASLFTPTWQYQLRSFYVWERQWIGSTIGGNLTSTGAENPDVTNTVIASGIFDPSPGVEDMLVYHPPMILGDLKTVTGPHAMNTFMIDYNATMHNGDQGLAIMIEDARRQGDTISNVTNCGGFGYFVGKAYPLEWFLPPSSGTQFSFNACSVVAQELRYKVYGTEHWSFVTGSCGIGIPGEALLSQGVAPEEHFVPYQDAQRVLISLTKVFFGISEWQFTDTDGNTQTVPAGACPVLPTYASEDELPDVFTYLPDEEPEVCDFDPFTPIVRIPLVPYPSESAGGGIGGPVDSGTGDFDGDFVLNDGTKGPIYPQYKGALAYDLSLKKWGKIKLEYLYLMDLSPINTDQGKIVVTQRFGVSAAAYLGTGYIHRFDAFPESSYIKYGKIGMHRLGYTAIEEVRVSFRLPVTGELEVASSLDGRNPEINLTKTLAYEAATWVTMGVGASGRWHTIKISGNYDIVHMEYTGLASGRR